MIFNNFFKILKSVGCICCLLIFVNNTWAQTYTITQLTNNDYHDLHPRIHNGQVTWYTRQLNINAAPWEIKFFDGTKINFIPTSTFVNFAPNIHNGQIIWIGDGLKTFFYNGSTTKQVSGDEFKSTGGLLHNGQVAWAGAKPGIVTGTIGDYDIFLYNGSTSVPISSNTSKDEYLSSFNNGQIGFSRLNRGNYDVFVNTRGVEKPITNNNFYDTNLRIHNGQMVWSEFDGNDWEVWYYDGIGSPYVQITDNLYQDNAAQIHNGQVVWSGYDGINYQIYFYDAASKTKRQITTNSYHDSSPKIHNGQVVWRANPDGNDYEIFYWDETLIEPQRITANTYHDLDPQIHNGQIVWNANPDGNDSEIFMASETPKIPLGGEVMGQDADAFYSIYVPTRWGGELIVTTDSGAVELYYPDTTTLVEGVNSTITHQVSIDQHGWYYVKHIGGGNYTIGNTFVQEGEADYRPWNFWYYPFQAQADPLQNLYGSGGALEKYDALFGTSAQDYEKAVHGNGVYWAGHCWGGSVASILLPQPEDAIYMTFTQEEVEGLVSELANIPALANRLIGNMPPVKPVVGLDNADNFSGQFQAKLVEYLRISAEKPLQSNLRDARGLDSTQVWNHAIYKYKSMLEEFGEGNENIIKITTTIYSNEDIFPSNNQIDRVDTYVYKLKYNLIGEIDVNFEGQDWMSATGFIPQDLNFIIGSYFNNIENNYVTKENVEKLGINFPPI